MYFCAVAGALGLRQLGASAIQATDPKKRVMCLVSSSESKYRHLKGICVPSMLSKVDMCVSVETGWRWSIERPKTKSEADLCI